MHLNKFNSFKTFILVLVLALPSIGWSNTVDETPTALAMSADVLFVRPVMLATTIVGSAIFIISAPFSGLGGNISDSWDVLVAGPFNTTFVRCLGCTMNGRKASSVVEQNTD